MVWHGKVVSHHWCDDCHYKESDWASRYQEPETFEVQGEDQPSSSSSSVDMRVNALP
jgi:hypothetical protein